MEWIGQSDFTMLCVMFTATQCGWKSLKRCGVETKYAEELLLWMHESGAANKILPWPGKWENELLLYFACC